ncbi:MAG: ABC transporter ATP-binding protein [Eubacterium sp.]|nr:ABC transporter ATP-binding protein [Eubacterium sp.]
MKPENAIEVKNVTKSFKIYIDKGNTLKEKALFKQRRRYEERNVLNNISFEVEKGQAVGLIGHNGCGKSTTLKLLTKIMYPDSGSIVMRGRVSSLIELGAGFHEDMSGRENIYINASIFGLTRGEINKRMEDIIAFSELEEFIDNPVRTYSSGMYMRLAFSIAINVDADILLVDEILTVGDFNFQAKCFNRLREVKASGTTIVIVSHSMEQIEQICDRSIWIHDGKIRREGRPRDVHPEYLDFMGEKRQELAWKEAENREENRESEEAKETHNENAEEIQVENHDKPEENKKRWGNGYARIEKIVLLDKQGKEKSVFKTGDAVVIQITYKVNRKVEDAVFGIGIFRSDGIQCYGTNTRIDKQNKFNLTKDGVVQINVPAMSLMAGEYLLDVAIEADIGIAVDYYKEAYRFEVFSDISDVGIARIEHDWKITDDSTH